MFRIFTKRGLAKLDDLYFPSESFKWTSPWWNLEENPDLRLGIQKELNLEIGCKHPLWGLKPVVFGKCDANDDIVVQVVDAEENEMEMFQKYSDYYGYVFYIMQKE